MRRRTAPRRFRAVAALERDDRAAITNAFGIVIGAPPPGSEVRLYVQVRGPSEGTWNGRGQGFYHAVASLRARKSGDCFPEFGGGQQQQCVAGA